MGRCTVMEGIVESRELGDHNLLGIAGNLKGTDQGIHIVVAHRTGRKLYAVADNIILLGIDGQRVLGVERFQTCLLYTSRCV